MTSRFVLVASGDQFSVHSQTGNNETLEGKAVTHV
jgi:hypothetical protein